MPCSDPHCPFLNREDDRCADHFQVSHLQHAFRYCFNHFKACPTYLELLVERRVRQVQAHAAESVQAPSVVGSVTLTIAGQAYAA